MPRTLSQSNISICAAATFALMLAGGSSYAHAAEEARTCSVSRISGTVTMLRQGELTAVAAGTRISGNDRLRTGEDARAEIVCSDGIMIVVGAATELDLGQIAQPTPRGVLLGLLEGIARFVLPDGRNRGSFAVTAPTAVASVRSTEWLMQVDPKGTGVLVVRGRVAVQGRVPGGIEELAEGEGVDVPPYGAVPKPRRWGNARVDAALRAVTF